MTVPLEGEIGGTAWTYKEGKAVYDFTNESYNVQLFATGDNNEGCFIIAGNEAYLSFELPPTEQIVNQPNFTLKSLTFHHPNSQVAYTATQGYIEIILVDDLEIRAIIDSRFDDDNYMQGIFAVDRCN